MNILITSPGVIPVVKYGGTQRDIWYLGKELVKMGHKVTYIVDKGSVCPFAQVIIRNYAVSFSSQIPDDTDIVHFHSLPGEKIAKPYMVSLHGNINDYRQLDINTVFVSHNHAARFGSDAYVYNGLDWDDYGKPDLKNKRSYYHFLGKAAWSVKNLKGAIEIIKKTPSEKLMVLGGNRLNISMGFRFTTSNRVRFKGMVGGNKKNHLINGSKGLIFPVRWSEPFGLAMPESLYFGCPVFATPYGSIPELIHQDVGFLSNKASELAEAALNADQYSRKTCHEYARDVFNSKNMADKFLDMYHTVLNGETLNNTPPRLIQKQEDKFLDFDYS
ncbi:MAG: glycosyltransferase [Bacteroidales bacterium]